ncbi:putative bifunctional diguanylate cyclase/phosphodiesterase [Enterovirga sp. GCM10030262]|uniref:putative bifunctional diguanylate cyclase/phosphodiesterase n=1 Tax=Enterovirga sp. GCM10030262 TaxID=3273391 RepID=UPI00360BE113
MMRVVSCLATEHNIWLVALAAGVCVAGMLVTLRLHRRAVGTLGAPRFGWHFLTAVSGGASIWSTHFIAMLGYEPGVPIVFEPVLTAMSLLIAMLGTGIGFVVATSGLTRVAPAAGGALVGLSIAAMHYTGMFAYRVEGLVAWDSAYVVASIVLAATLAGAALHTARQPREGLGAHLPTALMVLAIVSLHFTAMAAFSVTPMSANMDSNSAAYQAMALSIAVVGLVIVGSGISSHLIDSRTRSDSDDRLRHMALHDPLTGLPNRTSYSDFMARKLREAAARGMKLAVLGIDLDGFKEINDGWGHSAGDKALICLAERLRSIATDGGYAARLGGDEFAAVTMFAEEADLHAFVETVEQATQMSIILDNSSASIRASIGVAVFPRDGENCEALTKNADLAMYGAKADALQNTCYYDPQLGEAVRSRRALVEDLSAAIANEELTLCYQVQTSIAGDEIRGYEALVRWTHPTRGPIGPTEFIPLAESHGLIQSLGEWVLRRACRDAASWTPPYRVGVNLSAVQLSQSDFARTIHEILVETGLPPHRLELELTETALIKDQLRSLHVIRQIKALGVHVALDDFGTGYSSLETLRTFPFDKIKLDRTFVEGLGRSPQSLAIVRAVMALGKSLDIPVLAEGIETVEQLELLRSESCDEVQGFLLGRPIPLFDLAAQGGPKPLEASGAPAASRCRRRIAEAPLIRAARA